MPERVPFTILVAAWISISAPGASWSADAADTAETQSTGPAVVCGPHLTEGTCAALRAGLSYWYPPTLGTMGVFDKSSITLGRVTVMIEIANSPDLLSLLKLPEAKLLWSGVEYVYAPSSEVIRLNGHVVRLMQGMLVKALHRGVQLPYLEGNSIELHIKGGTANQISLSLGPEGPALLHVRSAGQIYLPSDETYAKAFASAAGTLPPATTTNAGKKRGSSRRGKSPR